MFFLFLPSYWTNPEEVETFPEIVAMEECLVESLNRLHKRKVLIVDSYFEYSENDGVINHAT